ncbi:MULTISPECIES: hypothetical protein [unclassified Bradyrhizobium]|uniref:hypothetical protein n=1 Tax=unclassified Bradyrhizobium TaxID=2631580 RepID=UPI002915DBF4|nr:MULTISPECIES: hypothetical protein [unclassified Bradyrhizobium]
MATKAEKLLHNITERVASWPEEDLARLDSAARQIESWRTGEYQAAEDELRDIDQAISEIERGELATPAQIEAAFRSFQVG